MIILHFDLQPQFKYMNYFIYASHKKIITPRPQTRTLDKQVTGQN